MDARGLGTRGMLSVKHPVVVLNPLGFRITRRVGRSGEALSEHPVGALGRAGLSDGLQGWALSGEALSEYPGVALSCAGVSGATSV